MKEKIILNSANPEQYGNLEIECKVIPNDKIGEYLESIPEERKFYAYKNAEVEARNGYEGEKVKTTLKTTVDEREYIISEMDNNVKSTTINGENKTDIVVKNINSTSNEEYIVKYEKFQDTYEYVDSFTNESGEVKHLFKPIYDSRLVTQISENVIIMTAWGAPALCLAGSYIVTYNADKNDYNTIEKGAFESTYVVEEQLTKKLKK